MAKSAELQRLNMQSDVMDAINRIGRKYGMLEVLEYMRGWVEFMDRAQAASTLIGGQDLGPEGVASGGLRAPSGPNHSDGQADG